MAKGAKAQARYETDLKKVVDRALAPVLAHNTALQSERKAVRKAMLHQQRRVDEWKAARMFMRGGGEIDRVDDGWMSPGIQYAGNITPAERSRLVSMAASAGRALYLRNPHASMAVELHVMFAIGNGVNYSFELPKRDQDRFLAVWNDWWYSNQCSVGMNMQGAGVDRMIVRTEKGQGEVLVRWHSCMDDYLKGRRALPLAIEVIQTTRIDSSRNEPWSQTDRAYTRDGIRYDSKGAPLGVWIFPIDPGEAHSIAEYVPMWDPKIGQQLHLHYDPKQPGLTRGADNGGMLTLDLVLDGADFRKENLRRQRLGSRRLGSVTTDEDTTGSLSGMFSEDMSSAEGEEMVAGRDFDPETGVIYDPENGTPAPKMPTYEEVSASITTQLMTPGSIPVLPYGWQFKDAPAVESPDYAPIQLDILMAIAVGYKVPYPWLSGDARQGNMSANKGIIQPFERETQWTQELFNNTVAAITCRNAILAANRAGIIRAGSDGRVSNAWFKTLGNLFPSSQPDKDMRVLIMAWANGFKTFDEVIVELGKDPKAHRAALEADREFYTGKKGLSWVEAGIPASISPQFMADFMKADGSEDQPTRANPETGN